MRFALRGICRQSSILCQVRYSDELLKGALLLTRLEQLCVAKAADSNWYRALVLRRTGPDRLKVHSHYYSFFCFTLVSVLFQVYFLDYGNTQEVERQSVHSLATQFAAVPPQAIHCTINGVTAGTNSDRIIQLLKSTDDVTLELSQ